jgi:uncharacterized protein (TIRG00374 family)
VSYLAERGGFEPPEPLPAHLFSRQASSTTPAPLHKFFISYSSTNILQSLFPEITALTVVLIDYCIIGNNDTPAITPSRRATEANINMKHNDINISLSTIAKNAPLVIGLLILGIGALFVPWNETIPYLFKLSPLTYLLLLVLGLAYYFTRILRYLYALRELGSPKPLSRVMLAYITAQPLSLLPGGEAFRVVTLKQYADVPASKGASVVFLQSFTENIGLVSLALLSAIILNKYILIIAIILAVYIVLVLLLRARRTATLSHRVITRLPYIEVSKTKINTFFSKNRQLLSGKSAVILLATSIVSALIASTALYVSARSLGVELDFVGAIIGFSLPMILQNSTALPGGIGINEQSSVGILLLFGVAIAPAIALTIIIRMLTQVLGMIIGLVVLTYLKFAK